MQQQRVLKGFGESRLIELLLHLLLLVVAVFVAAGVFVKADGRLDRIVAQEHLCVLVQVIETSRFRPEQPLRGERAINNKCNKKKNLRVN